MLPISIIFVPMNEVKSAIADKIRRFLPEQGIDQVVNLIAAHKVKFRITNPRKTKFGDYRSQDREGFHSISVNGNLNPFAFYLTTLHEFAHLIAFSEYGNRIAPHGEEWKMTFSQLLTSGGAQNWFPEDVRRPLKNYIRNPKASSASDHELFLALRRHNTKDQVPVVKDLLPGERFLLSGRLFERGSVRRKRVECKEVASGKMYLVNAIAEVKKVEV